jgi:shikimate kinase
MTAVTLVGFMGAGKTTVGRALATRLGWRFQDLDDLIQAREGCTIEQIFRDQGERAFRDLERLALATATTTENSGPLVLALGGGAFVQSDNQELLHRNGIPTVFLDAPVEDLFRRCEQPETRRPLRRSLREFAELYQRRRSDYMKAEFHVDTAGKEISSIVEEIVSALKLGVTA